MPRRLASTPETRTLIWICLPLLALFGCSGGGGGAGNGTETLPANGLLAAGAIGPMGGTLTVAQGPHAGVALTVPPGALTVPTDFSIRVDLANESTPSMFPVYLFEPAKLDLGGKEVAITIRAATLFFDENDPTPNLLAMFTRPGGDGAIELLRHSSTNELNKTISSLAPRLGRFVAWDGNLHRLFTQDADFLDPAMETGVANLFGVEITIANGPERAQLGRGSLASFWSAPASENVLILHGLSGSPLDFRGTQDLIASLSPSVHNVVLAVYPSARGVTQNANAFYDLIQAHRQPGFGCSILAHSMGGLVARYMIEQSAGDVSRSGYAPGDHALSEVVPHLFLIGTPNAGSDPANAIFEALLPNVPEADRRFLQAGVDLAEGPGSFTEQLNLAYVDNPTIYHTIYGDLGNGSDGIVSVASARAIPFFPPETETQFPAAHTSLHLSAVPLGVASLINSLLQIP